MKIPLSWLREYVDTGLTPAQIIDRLTIAGLEVSGVRVLGLPIPEGVRVKPEDRGPVWERDKVLVGEITSVETHPNADRLSLPTVAYGEGRTKRLVTGAPNVRPGDKGGKVVIGLTGAKLFDGHAQVPTIKELKPSKIRGEPSDSMVCSLLELGIQMDPKLSEGIILLEPEAPTGMPLADFMGDVVLEVDVLPNMARCLSIIGVAREASALSGQPLRLPPAGMQTAGLPIDGQVAVQIEDTRLCARYAACFIRDVKHGPAPGWMQRRLLYAGMRPINNIVDITNYVMLEWGQPLHAFDYDVLVSRAGGKPPMIVVRRGRPGEVLVTLDGVKRPLSGSTLVIADEQGPIALAGIMGGLETEVTEKTKNVLLESASFDFVITRQTMRVFQLPSEASVRFSRGVPPDLVKPALERAAELMRLHAGGSIAPGVADVYPAPPPRQTVTLPMAQVSRLLGMDFPCDEAVRILRSLEFEVTSRGDVLHVVVPPHRLDIQAGAADLIEELARIHGYDRLPATLLADRLPRQHTNVPIAFEEKTRDILVRAGLQEVISYALTTPEIEAPLLPAETKYVELLNPISTDRRVMRRSVLASVLQVAASNLRHAAGVRLFELGFVYLPRTDGTLPDESRRLAIVLTGPRQSEFWSEGTNQPANRCDFFDLKGIVEMLAGDLHVPNLRYQLASVPYLHPGRSATLFSGETALGDFGELHPKVAERFELGERSILVGEFDVEALQAAAPERFSYVPVPRFPAALRDIAVVVDAEIPNERVMQEIRAAGGVLLRSVRVFDVYRGDSIPAGTKSLAYALSYQADDRTLTDKEVDRAHKKIEDRLLHMLKAQIRGKN